jgi:hypothetical protein
MSTSVPATVVQQEDVYVVRHAQVDMKAANHAILVDSFKRECERAQRLNHAEKGRKWVTGLSNELLKRLSTHIQGNKDNDGSKREDQYKTGTKLMTSLVSSITGPPHTLVISPIHTNFAHLLVKADSKNEKKILYILSTGNQATYNTQDAAASAFINEALSLASRPIVVWSVFGATAESCRVYNRMTAFDPGSGQSQRAANKVRIELDANDVGITANDDVTSRVSDRTPRAHILSKADEEQKKEDEGRRGAVERAEYYVNMYDPSRHVHCLFIVKEGIMVATLIENWFVTQHKYKRVSDPRFDG